MTKPAVFLFFQLCLLTGPAAAGARADGGGLAVYTAITAGGDTLATAEGEDIDQDLKAGGLIHIGLGYEHRFDGFGARATLGYKFDTLDADNGDAEISRYPLEIGLFKHIAEHHVLGVGVVHERSPEFDIDIDNGLSGTLEFEDATGAMAHYGFLPGERFEFGLRYTDIEYELDDTPFVFDAGNWGLYINMFFP